MQGASSFQDALQTTVQIDGLDFAVPAVVGDEEYQSDLGGIIHRETLTFVLTKQQYSQRPPSGMRVLFRGVEYVVQTPPSESAVSFWQVDALRHL